MKQQWWLAVQFMTRLPTPTMASFDEQAVAQSVRFLPLVGALIGLILVAVTVLGSSTSSELTALLVLLCWVWVSGALHLDGVADLSDALAASHQGQESFYRVLKEPHIGVFGVVAVVLLLLAKFVLLFTVLEQQQSVWVLLLVPAWARLGAILWAKSLPALHEGRASSYAWEMADHIVLLYVAGLFVLGLLIAPWLFFAAGLAIAAWWWFLQAKLGGVNGDCLGAGIEVTECLMLLLWLMG